MNVDQRRAFLEQLSWESSQLTPEEQAMVERLLLKYHHIFARHRLDIGINNEFKTKLTPKHDELVAVQNLPTPKKLKDKMLVDLGVQKVYGILKKLLFIKYSSPVFSHLKPNGKLHFHLTWDGLTISSSTTTTSTIIQLRRSQMPHSIWWEKVLKQAWLFPSLPLPANGTQAVHAIFVV